MLDEQLIAAQPMWIQGPKMLRKTRVDQEKDDECKADALVDSPNVLAPSDQSVASGGDSLDENFAYSNRALENVRAEMQMARREARSNLERSRAELIQLIEQVRAERSASLHVAGAAPGASVAAVHQRLDAVEGRVAGIEETLTRCFERQNELAATMEALLDTMLRERRGEPVSGLRLT